jgi:hypothetical protein
MSFRALIGIWLALATLTWTQTAAAKSFAFGQKFLGRHYGVTLCLDPYESYVSVYYNLRTKPPGAIEAANEMEFYGKLFLKSFQPYYVLVQGTDYPLAHIGSALHHYRPEWYHRIDWRPADSLRLNAFELLASGYEEPYALSLFLGYLAPFWGTGDQGQRKQVGSASSGFVFTVGDLHLRAMDLLEDNWYELKWSLKGTRETRDSFLKWDIQLGGKLHDNRAVLDAFFVRAYRDHLDRKNHAVFTLQNAGIEYRAEMPMQRPAEIQGVRDFFSLQYIDLNKKFPSRRWPRIVYAVNAGAVWQKYDEFDHYSENVSWFVRPNVLF